MARLRLRLLGGFEAQWDLGPPLTVPTRRAQALLVARCRLGLGVLLAGSGRREDAVSELAVARDLFAEMGIELWRVRAEHALAGSG